MSQLMEHVHERVNEIYYDQGRLNLDKLCEDLNIRLTEAEFYDSEMSGVLEKMAEGYKIVVNKALSLPQKRFTVAHEIGHFFQREFSKDDLPEPYTRSYIADRWVIAKHNGPNEEWDPIIEGEANEIAAAILMPKDAILYKWNTEGKNLEELAYTFGVSQSAVIYRLKRLGIELLETFTSERIHP